MPGIERQWYWDRRTDEAYYPLETDGDTVAFVTVRHAEEVADARAAGAFVPIDEMDFNLIDGTAGLKESFRLPDDPPGTGGD